VPNQRTSVRIMSEALCEGYNNVLLPAIASRVGQYDFGLACARSAPRAAQGNGGRECRPRNRDLDSQSLSCSPFATGRSRHSMTKTFHVPCRRERRADTAARLDVAPAVWKSIRSKKSASRRTIRAAAAPPPKIVQNQIAPCGPSRIGPVPV
jgi:hypothetical protein